MTEPFKGWGIRVRWLSQKQPRMTQDVFFLKRDAIASWDATFGEGDYEKNRRRGYIKAVKVKVVEVVE